jgi:hypothetical protein
MEESFLVDLDVDAECGVLVRSGIATLSRPLGERLLKEDVSGAREFRVSVGQLRYIHPKIHQVPHTAEERIEISAL